MAKPKKPAAKKAPAKQHSTTTSRSHGAAASSRRAGSSSARTPTRGTAAVGNRKLSSRSKRASSRKSAPAKGSAPAKRIGSAKTTAAAKRHGSVKTSAPTKRHGSAKTTAPAKRHGSAKRPVVARKVAAPRTARKAPAPVRSALPSKLSSRTTPATKGKSALLAKFAPAAKPSVPSRPLGAAIDAYIKGLGDWRSDAVTHICQLLVANAPRAKGLIRFGHPVYEQKGPFAYVKALPHIVQFGFWRGARLEDADKVLVGEGDRMRHVKLWSAAEVREERFSAWIREAVRLNQEFGDPTKNLA